VGGDSVSLSSLESITKTAGRGRLKSLQGDLRDTQGCAVYQQRFGIAIGGGVVLSNLAHAVESDE
jgi:hypothetical protein